MLEHFFGSKTRVKLMHVFFQSPDKPFYVRELARLTETQLNAVRRELANLEALGIVTTIPSEQVAVSEGGTERSKYYQLKADSMLLPELKALLGKAQVLEEKELVESLQQKGGHLQLFILTGIFTGDKESPTDILMVGQLKPVVIAKLIKEYEEEGRRSIRYTLMDDKEFRDRREIGDKFLYGIFESKHILVVNEYQLS